MNEAELRPLLDDPAAAEPWLRSLGLSDAATAHGVFVRDSFPVSPGHTLVIPVRHFGSFFDAAPDETVRGRVLRVGPGAHFSRIH